MHDPISKGIIFWSAPMESVSMVPPGSTFIACGLNAYSDIFRFSKSAYMKPPKSLDVNDPEPVEVAAQFAPQPGKTRVISYLIRPFFTQP
jgi:hypothetical protein